VCAAYDIVVKLLGAVYYLVLLPRAGVNERKLQQCREDEQHAGGVPDVDRLEIGDTHRVATRRRQLGRHCQYGRHAECYACRFRVLVDPEPNPGQHHDQHRWNICLKNEEANLAL